MLDLNAVIDLAARHADNCVAMQSSAKLCLSDAVRLRGFNLPGPARVNALKSLSYSVGIFHADYKAAQVGA